MDAWPVWVRITAGLFIAGAGIWAAHRIWHAGGVLV